MTKKKQPPGDYEVGYRRPPKEHQIKKGERRNPKGRSKLRKAAATDVAAILDEPIKVRVGGKEHSMSPFEASFRKVAKRAAEGHLPSILKFIKICEEYDVIEPPEAQAGGGVIVAPRGVDFHEWLESVTELVPVDET